jgi:hypothetical protein
MALTMAYGFALALVANQKVGTEIEIIWPKNTPSSLMQFHLVKKIEISQATGQSIISNEIAKVNQVFRAIAEIKPDIPIPNEFKFLNLNHNSMLIKWFDLF